MNSRGKLGQRLVAATIVAVGFAVVWGIALGWVASLSALLIPRQDINEQIAVAYDGTPVISVYSNDSMNQTTLARRTLDGKPWPMDYELWLNPAYPRRFEFPPGVVQLPIRWSGYGTRVGGGSDGKKPPTAWYVVSADPDAAYLYFAGFDPISKLPVGYIGTAGFRLTTPPISEQFACTANAPGNAVERVATSQYLERSSVVRYFELSAYDRPSQWLMFLVDGKRLWEIDLRERSARVVLEAPDSLSVALMIALEATVDAAAPDANVNRARPTPFRFTAMQGEVILQAIPPAASLRASNSTGALSVMPGATTADVEPPKTKGIVVARTPDRLLFYDASTANQWEFQLPQEEVPSDKSFSVNWIDADTILVDRWVGNWSDGSVRQLYWLSPDGSIERQDRVELQGYVTPPESRSFWELLLCAPEPVVWAGAVFGAAPFERVQHYKSPTYAAAVDYTLGISWPPAVLVLCVSIAAAWYTQRLHRACFRRHPGVWAAFVFLFGVPGLVAYWLEHRRSRLEICGECDTPVPRDRDACAACHTPFPAPAPVGTEIFA